MDKNSYMTIKEINTYAIEHNLPKFFKSYSAVYKLVQSSKVPVYKAGNRYLLRIVDIEEHMTRAASPLGVRRID